MQFNRTWYVWRWTNDSVWWTNAIPSWFYLLWCDSMKAFSHLIYRQKALPLLTCLAKLERSRTNLEQPRLELLVKHDVKAEHFEARARPSVVGERRPIVMSDDRMGRDKRLDDYVLPGHAQKMRSLFFRHDE